jgi:hypothetical protein
VDHPNVDPAQADNVSALARRIAQETGLNYNTVRRELNANWVLPARHTTERNQEFVQEVRRRYSGWVGKPQSVRQIARELKVLERDVYEVVRAQKLTHSAPPIEVLSELEERELFERFQRQSRKAVETKATKYDQLSNGVYNPLVEWLTLHFGPAPTAPREVVLDPTFGSRLLVLHPTDLHIGKAGADGKGSDEMVKAFWKGLSQLVFRGLKVGVDRIVSTIGNDWFHIDTLSRTTTRGTPQDTDRDAFGVVQLGYALAFEYVEWLRAMRLPVDIVVVSSNHDAFAMLGLGHALALRYADVPEVTIHHTAKARQYLSFGKNLLGFTHGHQAKPQNLPRHMADEVPRLWADCPFRYWITGHLHHARHKADLEVDSHGVHILQGPSISLTDRWHENEGWTLAQKALVAYTFNADNGHEDRMFCNVVYKSS